MLQCCMLMRVWVVRLRLDIATVSIVCRDTRPDHSGDGNLTPDPVHFPYSDKKQGAGYLYTTVSWQSEGSVSD